MIRLVSKCALAGRDGSAKISHQRAALSQHGASYGGRVGLPASKVHQRGCGRLRGGWPTPDFFQRGAVLRSTGFYPLPEFESVRQILTQLRSAYSDAQPYNHPLFAEALVGDEDA
jgi:hypothetical protein